jgi:hypothetical protein
VVLPACVVLNFGMSHTINGLSKLQNLVLVVYSNLLLLPTLYKIIKKELVFSEDHCLVLLGINIYTERERERERKREEREKREREREKGRERERERQSERERDR